MDKIMTDDNDFPLPQHEKYSQSSTPGFKEHMYLSLLKWQVHPSNCRE